MTNIFKPAIYLMNKFKFFKKFIIIFIVFLIPLCTLMTMQIRSTQNIYDIKLSQSEGIHTNILLRTMIQHMQEHRGMSSTYLNGNKDFKKDLELKGDELKKDIDALNQALTDNKDLANVKEDWSQIQKELSQIQTNLDQMTAKESFVSHTALIQKALELTQKISTDTSLVLQDDTSSYFLVEMTMSSLPTMAEKMGQSRARGSGIAAKKEITTDDKQQLLSLLESINFNMRVSTKAMTILLKEEPSISILKESYDKAISSTDLLKNTITAEFIEKDQISIESKEYFDLATSSINDVYTFLNEVSMFLYDKADQELIKAKFNITLVSSLGIITALIVIYLFVGLYLSIKGTIYKISNVASVVASGNLRTRIELETSDETIEIAGALNQVIGSFHQLSSQGQVMAKNLNESADALQSVTEHTTESAQRIAESMAVIMSQTDNQLQSTTAVSQVMHQIAEGVQEIAENSSEVATSSSEMEQAVDNGYESLQLLSRKMDIVQVEVDATSEVINQLGNRSKDIGEIIATIEAIASQTNLLALNAAIEAARAGEHGRGFSVVADEVRKLAELSQVSTERVSSLIKGIKDDVDLSVSKMAQVKSETLQGIEQIVETEKVFKKINESASYVTSQIEGISAATQEISASAEEITSTLLDVGAMAEKNAEELKLISDSTQEQLGSMEEATASAVNLNERASDLNDMTKNYEV